MRYTKCRRRACRHLEVAGFWTTSDQAAGGGSNGELGLLSIETGLFVIATLSTDDGVGDESLHDKPWILNLAYPADHSKW